MAYQSGSNKSVFPIRMEWTELSLFFFAKWRGRGRNSDWKGYDLENQKSFSIARFFQRLFLQSSLPRSLSFRPPFPFLQSSCQPATSSGAATAASWRETAPSVSALMALRSARTVRAAEVGFSCAGGGGGALAAEPFPYFPASFRPRPNFSQMNKQEVLGIWEPFVCRHGVAYSAIHPNIRAYALVVYI